VQWLSKQDVKPDRVILVSDMQCWNDGYCRGNFADEWYRYKKHYKNTWLHSVNVNGYGDSVVMESDDKVNLVGAFSEKIMHMLLTTEGAWQDAVPTVEQIRENW